VEQAEAGIQYLHQVPHSRVSQFSPGFQLQFGDLNIPVSELAPEKVVDLAACLPILEILEQPLDVAHQDMQPGVNPGVSECEMQWVGAGWWEELPIP